MVKLLSARKPGQSLGGESGQPEPKRRPSYSRFRLCFTISVARSTFAILQSAQEKKVTFCSCDLSLQSIESALGSPAIVNLRLTAKSISLFFSIVRLQSKLMQTSKVSFPPFWTFRLLQLGLHVPATSTEAKYLDWRRGRISQRSPAQNWNILLSQLLRVSSELRMSLPMAYRMRPSQKSQETNCCVPPQILGSKGERGTERLPHFQLESFSTCTSKVVWMPSFSMSTEMGRLSIEMVTFCLPGTLGTHLQSNCSPMGWCSSCRLARRQKSQYLSISFCSSVRTSLPPSTELSIFTMAAMSSAEASGGSMRVSLKAEPSLLKVTGMESSNSQEQKPVSITIFLAMMISKLRPWAEPVPVRVTRLVLDQLKVKSTSRKPPSMTMVSLPRMTAFCLESRQQKEGLTLETVKLMESEGLQVTSSSEVIFSWIFAKVRLSSSCLPSVYRLVQSKWVALQLTELATCTPSSRQRTAKNLIRYIISLIHRLLIKIHSLLNPMPPLLAKKKFLLEVDLQISPSMENRSFC